MPKRAKDTDMKIGIVEDEVVWRNKIQAVIEKYCRDKNISSQINSYGSGKDFMKNPDADLLFLDIELAEDRSHAREHGRGAVAGGY